MGNCNNVNPCCGGGWNASGRYAFILVLDLILSAINSLLT